MKRILGAAAATAMVIGLGVATPQAQADGYDIRKGPNTSNKVILTYDDCPKSVSSFRSTIAAATKMGVAIAVFPTGDCISAGRIDVGYARSMGHYVFNHSVSHPDLTTLSFSGVQRQLGSPGVVTTYGRPPYGATNSTVASAYASVGMKQWLWTVDTNDWRGKSTSELISYVVSTARPGDTVLMHMQWNGFNATAISAMKSGLAKRGIGLCQNQGKPTPVRPSGVVCTGGTQTPTPKPSWLGDRNGDRKADVFGIRNSDGALLAWPSNSTSRLGSPLRLGSRWSDVNWMSSVPDLDNNGISEVVGRRTDGTMWLYKGLAGGRLAAGVKIGHGWQHTARITVVGDTNGDKRPELIGRDATGNLRLYRFTATGALSSAGTIGYNWKSINHLATVGDTNADGLPDLLAVNTAGDLMLYRMTKSGSLASGIKVGPGWQGTTHLASPGDMTGDGKRDLVRRTANGDLYLYVHKGGVSFAKPVKIGSGFHTVRLGA